MKSDRVVARVCLRQRMCLWRNVGPPQTKQTKEVLGFQGQETGRMCSWEETDGVRFMYGFYCCCHVQSTAVRLILSIGPCFLVLDLPSALKKKKKRTEACFQVALPPNIHL